MSTRQHSAQPKLPIKPFVQYTTAMWGDAWDQYYCYQKRFCFKEKYYPSKENKNKGLLEERHQGGLCRDLPKLKMEWGELVPHH